MSRYVSSQVWTRQRPTVPELIVFVPQISPFILNTVQTITAAMTTKQSEEQGQVSEADLGDLWSVKNVYGCNYWFLGVDQATELTESFREQDGRQAGESLTAEVKVRLLRRETLLL